MYGTTQGLREKRSELDEAVEVVKEKHVGEVIKDNFLDQEEQSTGDSKVVKVTSREDFPSMVSDRTDSITNKSLSSSTLALLPITSRKGDSIRQRRSL